MNGEEEEAVYRYIYIYTEPAKPFSLYQQTAPYTWLTPVSLL